VNTTVMSGSHTVLGEKPQDALAPATGEDAALQALVDATRKRLAALEKQSAPSAVDRFEHYLIEGVYAVILAVTVGAWAVLGFVVWVPLLVRTTTFLAGTVFYISLFRNPARMADAQSGVHFAVRFYGRGFEHFLGFYRQRREPEKPAGLFEPLTTMTRDDLLVECVWVVTVWMATVFTVYRATSALVGA
jgi:hypothetical protein